MLQKVIGWWRRCDLGHASRCRVRKQHDSSQIL
jgi:hypothetical protein